MQHYEALYLAAPCMAESQADLWAPGPCKWRGQRKAPLDMDGVFMRRQKVHLPAHLGSH